MSVNSKKSLAVKHMSRNEYLSSKNIPESAPLNKLILDNPAHNYLVNPTPNPSYELKKKINVRENREEIERRAQQQRSEGNQIDALMKRLVELEQQLELERSANLDLERELMETNGAKTELEKRLILLEREIRNQTQEELKKLRADNINLKKQLQALEAHSQDHSNSQVQVQYLQQELGQLNSEYHNLLEEKNRNEAQAALGMKERDDTISNLKNIYNSEKTRLEKLLKEKDFELQEHRHALNGVDINRQDWENSLQDLSNEVERLTSILNEKNRETEQWRAKVISLEKAHLQEIEDMKTHMELMRKSLMERDNSEWAARIEAERISKREIENRLVLLYTENERIMMILQDVREQKENLMQEYRDLENRYRNDLDEIRNHTEHEKRSIIEKEMRSQSERFSKERAPLENKIIQLENAVALATTENERLRLQIKDKDKEIEIGRSKYSNLEQSHREYLENLKEQYEHMLRTQSERETNDVKSKLAAEKSRYDQAQASQNQRVRELESSVTLLMSENERNNSLLTQKEKEIDKLKTRQINEKNALESENIMLKGEKDKLTMELKDKEGELDYWKGKFNQIESAYKNRISEMQSTFESAKKSHAERELKLAQSQISSERMKIEIEKRQVEESLVLVFAECERLHALLENYSVESSNLKNRNSILENELAREKERFNSETLRKSQMDLQYSETSNKLRIEKDTLENQIRIMREKLIEAEDRIGMLATENERLNFVLKEKKKELENMEQHIQRLERAKSEEIDTLRTRLENQTKRAFEIDTQSLYQKQTMERNQYENDIRTLKQKIIEFENKVTYLSVEIERLNSMLRDKQSDIEQWQEKYNLLEREATKELEELNIQFEAYKKSSLDRTDWEIKFNAERTSYETRIMQLQQKIKDYEDRINILASENKKLEALGIERMREIENWKIKYSKSNDGEIEDLKSQMEIYKKTNLDVKEFQMKYAAEKASLENTKRQLQQELENKNNDLERAYELLRARKSDYESSLKQNEEIRNENVKLRMQLKNLEADLLIKMETFEKFKRENGELNKSVAQKEEQLYIMRADVSKKNDELNTKITELNMLKNKYEEALNSITNSGYNNGYDYLQRTSYRLPTASPDKFTIYK